MAEPASEAGRDTTVHRGGCHCGRVRFEVDAPSRLSVLDCNCSICHKTGYLHLIVPRAAFRLLAGEDATSEYRFGTGVARHLFCRHCGIKCFYVPRSHPEAIDVNLRCIDPDTIESVQVEQFDGRGDWEAQAAGLRAER
jgi:hypothetical protein